MTKRPKYVVGDRVWLAEFDNGDEVVPREQAVITGVQTNKSEIMYTGQVRSAHPCDDGVREFSEDQVEGTS